MSLRRIMPEKDSIWFTNSPKFTCWEPSVNPQQHTEISPRRHLADPGDRAPGYFPGHREHSNSSCGLKKSQFSWLMMFFAWAPTLWRWHSWLLDNWKRHVFRKEDSTWERKIHTALQSSDRKNKIVANLLLAWRTKSHRSRGISSAHWSLGEEFTIKGDFQQIQILQLLLHIV